MNSTVCAGQWLPFCGSVSSESCQQENDAVAYLPKITSVASILGAVAIIFAVLRHSKTRKKHRIQSTDRMLLLVALSTILGCIGYFLGEWSFDSWDVCAFQGFIIQVATMNIWANAALTTAYTLRVSFRWTQDEVRKYEPYVMGLVIGFPIITAIIGLALGLYAPAGPWCWVGSNYLNVRWVFFYGELWFLMAFTLVCMLLIVRTVYHSDKQVAYLFSGDGQFKRLSPKSRRMAFQAILYVVFFVITWVPATINRFVGGSKYADGGRCVYFELTLLHGMFGPAGGFFSFLVHFYPKCFRDTALKQTQTESVKKSRDQPHFRPQRLRDDDEVGTNQPVHLDTHYGSLKSSTSDSVSYSETGSLKSLSDNVKSSQSENI